MAIFKRSDCRCLADGYFPKTMCLRPLDVMVVNESFFRQYFPNENPLGHKVK